MKKVTVLMSTYNGEKYIAEQLDSVLTQNMVDVRLVIRDDGSTDRTVEIVKEYIDKYDNIYLKIGKNCGPARSFWTLMTETPDSDYYAFCDQDDVWIENKLQVAIEKLENRREYRENIPAMYYCNTCLVDSANKRVIQQSQNAYSLVIPTFPQLVMENNASGCTMVWNKALQNIASKVVPVDIRMHDHLLYLICQFCEGFVYHDIDSYIRYRQHSKNVIGGDTGVKKYLKSIQKYLAEDSGLVKQALSLQQICNYTSSKENKEFIEELSLYKERGKHDIKIYKKVSQGSLAKKLCMLGLIILGRF